MLGVLIPLSVALAADAPLSVDLDEVFAPDAEAWIYVADLAVTDDGTVHVLVGANSTEELWYTNDAEGGWSSYTVAAGKDNSGSSNLEMTLDGDGRVRAAFDPGPGDVFGLALRDDVGAWSVEPLVSGARWLRVLFGPDDTLHVAYSEGGLRYGGDATGPFTTELVRETGVFDERAPVLVSEDAPFPAVAFVDRQDFANPTVQLGRRIEGVWTFETVSEDGAGPLGVVRADDGALHAVFGRDDGSANLTWVHAIDPGTGWSEEAVLPVTRTGVGDGSPLDLALVGDQVVWADGEGGLRFVVGQPGAWRTFLAADGLAVRVVRLEHVGDRLLALVVDEANGVSFAELDVADADADGMPNAFDGCPDDDAKVEPGVCGCGVAEADPCTADTDVPVDTDVPDDDADGGCGCATGGAGGGAALLGLLAIAARRRRR